MNDNFETVFNSDYLGIIVGSDDRNLMKEIYQEFITNLVGMLKIINNPHASKDEVYISIHNQKASSRSVGANHLAKIIDRCESAILRGDNIVPLELHQMTLACIQTIELVSKHLEYLDTSQNND